MTVASKPRVSDWMLIGPRTGIVLAAVVIEIAALCLWPAVYLLDSPQESSRLGEMFLQRYPPLAAILASLKAGVTWVAPGALEEWDALVSFTFGCVVIAFAAYAVAAWRVAGAATGLSLRWVLVPLLLFQLTLLFVPATLTTDIFSYALYGQMPVVYESNPFVHMPAEFPQSPLYYFIPLYWHDAPSVYGPLWALLSAGVASVFRPLPLADELLFYRIISNVAHPLNAVLVWALARRMEPTGRSAPAAALAYAWNPLLLVEFALNGHNDVLMLTFVLATFLLSSHRRFHLAALALGLSIGVKYASVLVVPILFWWGARYGLGTESGRGRIKAGLTWCAITGGTVAVLYAPWFQGMDTFGPVLYWAAGPRLHNFWPESSLMSLAAWSSGLLGTSYAEAWEALLGGFKLAAKAGFAVYILVEAYRARTLDDVLRGSAGVALAFLLLVNTWVMPWYYAWPLAFCAALGWGSALVRACAGFSLTAMVLMYQRQFGYAVVDEWAGLFLVLPLVLILLPRGLGLAVGRGWAAVAALAAPERDRPEGRVPAGRPGPAEGVGAREAGHPSHDAPAEGSYSSAER